MNKRLYTITFNIAGAKISFNIASECIYKAIDTAVYLCDKKVSELYKGKAKNSCCEITSVVIDG